ncbi:low molecular weight phosphotyrosine protein phosphatase [Halobacillus yeomjeoni]|uniref:low molecular weight protein-tyrosine-phosphatase n=1 Tax=Halobacillus yeomjeoni TaxID=311194 RepID=UPI001CD6E0C0|nr:low molecular weight protein-tyrosine-phosphatase [Halobacillus yeomjeoni]MCA0984135.1 low molecular weight phosphotyrosine protein phosphatase [Halobacillus yeomjeoni]
MIRVLFVCLGNICRSPMAEAVFKHQIEEEGLKDRIQVDSAGIGHWHIGSLPHEGTRKILDDKQISYKGMAARQVKESDWDDFDYIIAMDDKNISDLQAIREKNGVTVAKLLDFVPESDEGNVPDPYFTGNFEYVYDLVTQGCTQLLEQIKKDHHL